MAKTFLITSVIGQVGEGTPTHLEDKKVVKHQTKRESR